MSKLAVFEAALTKQAIDTLAAPSNRDVKANVGVVVNDNETKLEKNFV